ncbi:DHA2 family efflux MFS transporter permease subunit [Streptosporangium roseum]|uniref:Transmembrane efflux protein n=1 Tax=Streptosporangium roseum (strain ATCC 12428 / DSM 43021 / JCM 3005 / KCTC 9067 / NCIMB 10171 / NRRL 2505 / NI 9100) TaxID=479432 RepID=D2B3A0_STRRD|nr:DHA2 family efflux MFS transporter permease subunit [Streptosporangium roseum]ACZ87416.1 putative transmembrane efflux protein [Streptosporangium roseum DSM 43021]
MIVLCLVQFMLVLDDTVVNVALPSIRDELGFSASGLPWVVNAYFLAFGGLLLLCGRMADLLGRRRVFLIGVALFGVASLACGLAQEPWQLVIGRFVQGAGSAMASPAAMSMITLLYPGPQERAKALGIWGGIAALGGTSGLVLSGALTDLVSWRGIFLINLPIVAVALALLPRLVPESRAPGRRRLDVPGAVLVTGAAVSLVYGLLRAGETGWSDPIVIGAVVLSAALAVAFLVAESRAAAALVPPSFLASRTRAVANVATLLFSMAMYAMSFLLMIQVQTALGYSPLLAGIAYLPYGAGILAGMWLSSRISLRIGTRWALLLAFLVNIAGLLLLSGLAAGDSYAAHVLPGMLILSVGNGLSLPVMAVAAVDGTTEEDAGLGSALFTSVQQIGGAVGVAALAIMGYSGGLTAGAVCVALGAVLIVVLLPSRAGGPRRPAGHGAGGRSTPTAAPR